MLICDDVRVELGGTMTLVGVHSERLIVPPGDGPIRIPRLMIVAIVGGLEGADSVAFRQRLRELSVAARGAAAPQQEPHDPRADEHNFVFGDAPMVFPGPGVYEVSLEVEALDERATYTCTFKVERG